MRLSVTVSIAALSLAALSAAAEAATLQVGPGKPFATIADAVAAASRGDRIVVYKGRYTESVFVAARSNLVFQARPGVEWLPATFGGTCLTLSQGADGARVQGFTFRSTGTAVLGEGVNDVAILKCRFRGTTVAIDIDGDRVRVTSCDVRRVVNSVRIVGADCRIEKTSVIAAFDHAIDVTGDGAVIVGNTVRTVADHSGIAVIGSGATIERNSVAGAQASGIDVEGHDAVVSRNEIGTNGYDGIHIVGDRSVVERNEVRSPSDDGIDVSGQGFTVRGNRIYDAIDTSGAISVENLPGAAPAVLADNVVDGSTSTGIRISGVGVRSSGNRVSDCAEPGFRLFGSDHELTGDVVTGAGQQGFLVDASGVTFTRCEAIECGGDGFRINLAGITLTGCRASAGDAEGLHCGSTGTATFSGCTFLGNRQDVAVDAMGSLTDGGRNKFETGGVTATPVEN